MFSFLTDFILDTPSFWIGFIAGAIFWSLFLFVKNSLPAWRVWLNQKMAQMRDSMTASTETRLRNDVLHHVERLHLASVLFPLEDILIEPRILYPPAAPDAKNDKDAQSHEDVFTQTLPYLPDWPELAAAFNAPTFSLKDALSGGANLVLIGHPGSGKTVALAHLAAALLREPPPAASDDEEGKESAPYYLPVLVHAADISPTFLDTRPPLDTLVEAISARASTLTLARLPRLIETELARGSLLLLLDGLDEVPPVIARQIIHCLSELLTAHPSLRVVAATSPDYYDGLTTIGLVPVAMAAWGAYQRSDFVAKWQQAWERHFPPAPNAAEEKIDPFLIRNWLEPQESAPTPLEFTLKVWAAFAGDAISADSGGAIEAYLRRMTVGVINARPVLEKIAYQTLGSLHSICLQREAETWVIEYEQPIGVPAVEEEASAEKDKAASAKGAVKPPPAKIMPALIHNGLLIRRPESRLNFIHPMIFSYLAGQAYAKSGNFTNLENQPDWSGKHLAFGYMTQLIDITSVVNKLLSQADDPLRRGTLVAARWLRLAPKNAAWRASTLRLLVNLLQKEYGVIGFSARVITALATTGEAGMAPLFRQMLKSGDATMMFLAVLGCGLMRDAKSIPDLINFTRDENTPELGELSCLALHAIGDKAANDAVLAAMMQGSETIRNTAAEILALDPKDGHAVLKEALKESDLLARRAAVYGLSRVRQPWALKEIEKIAVEDAQWVVRNTAVAALEESKKINLHIPRPLPALHESPWLIAYAGRQGVGITAGKPAIDMLVRAAKDLEAPERLYAINYFRLRGGEEAIVPLYNAIYGPQGLIRESAYSSLWHLASTGINLPPPTQYGLG